MKEASTPEQSIKAFRDANIELSTVKNNLSKLQDLVTQASGAGGLLGFVGGSQAIAVWGIIVVVAVGFIFLAVTLRAITKGIGGRTPKSPKVALVTPLEDKGDATKKLSTSRRQRLLSSVLVVMIVSTAVSSAVTFEVLNSRNLVNQKKEAPSEKPKVAVVRETLGSGTGGVEIVKIVPQDGQEVTLYSKVNDLTSSVISLKDIHETVKIGEDGDWTNLLFDDASSSHVINVWAKSEYIMKPDAQEVALNSKPATLTIKETPTGWLRVRSAPSGEEVGKVAPGETYNLISEDSGWYQIEYNSSESAWISADYAEIN